MARNHFGTKNLDCLVKEKYNLLFNQLCTKLSKRLSGELSHVENEDVQDDVVRVSATNQIITDKSVHASPDATVKVPRTIAKAEVGHATGEKGHKARTQLWHVMSKTMLSRQSPREGCCSAIA